MTLCLSCKKKKSMAVGVVAAFPGTPLRTIRESSSSWGSPRSTANPGSLPACQEDEQKASIGSHAKATDTALQLSDPLQGEPRADDTFQLAHKRQAGHAVKGQRAEGTFQADSERQSSHEVEGQRAKGFFQADSERQAGNEVKGKEAEAAGSLQSPCDSVSEVAESLVLSHGVERQASSSAASVMSEVMSEADSAVQAVLSADASGELFGSAAICLLQAYTGWCSGLGSCEHQARSCLH